jgi:hypothetical protein
VPTVIAGALALGDRNLADYVSLLATAAGGEAQEADGLVLFAGVHAYPGTHTNGLLRLDDGPPADEALARADAFFAARRRSYTVWIREDVDADLEALVRARGFELRPPDEGMGFILRDAPFDLAEHEPQRAVTLRALDDDGVAVDYVRVVGEAFGMAGAPVEVLARVFFDPRALRDTRVTGCVAYLDGQAVAGGHTFVTGDYAGQYSIATVESARGMALGRFCMARCVNDGLARGAKWAGAQSSEMGHPVWSKMGFDTVAHYRRYIGRAAA